MTLDKEIREIVESTPIGAPASKKDFNERINSGSLTRDEDSKTHFCVYFLPYNQQTKKVFLVHHKKSGLWLSPGGHIDKGESPNEALNREIAEELGMNNFFTEKQKPFLLTTVDITNPKHPCDKHYDLWFLLKTDGSQFVVDPTEFYDTAWITIEQALEKTGDEANKIALRFLSQTLP